MANLMASSKNLDNVFRAALADYMSEFEDEFNDALLDAADKSAETAADMSPAETSAYALGWRNESPDGFGGNRVVVYDSSKPSLTHLLERGHMARDGSWVSPIAHIGPAFEAGMDELLGRLGIS